ncbi:MAG: FecR domain-containing protein [Elusimicrobia bacterium]|nr:FecR domain-containing protein [Elusimicrobiota bacterium]
MNSLLLAVVLAAAPSMAAPTTQKPVAGVLLSLLGAPTVTSADGKAKKLKRQQFICESDVIKTGAGERATIALVGGAELRINENSEFIVDSGGGKGPAGVSANSGQAWIHILHGKSGIDVAGPSAVAAIRGAEADVEIGKGMIVKVYEGRVDLRGPAGAQSLEAGMIGQVGAAPRRMAPSDYGTWQDPPRKDPPKQGVHIKNKPAPSKQP